MKETTRDLILDISRKLFNEHGTYNVSVRQIALELGISQGNLNYHFKKKEDIIRELYMQSVATLTIDFLATPKLGANFIYLFELARKTFEIQNTYKFLIADINYLVKDIPEIKESHQAMKSQRVSQFHQMFNVFIEKGYVREQEYSGEYDELGLRLSFLGIYSFLELEITDKSGKEENLKKYLNIIFSACYPYLTKSGKEKYLAEKKEYNF